MAPFLDDVDHIPDLDTQVHRDIFVIEKIFSFIVYEPPFGIPASGAPGQGAYGKTPGC